MKNELGKIKPKEVWWNPRFPEYYILVWRDGSETHVKELEDKFKETKK